MPHVRAQGRIERRLQAGSACLLCHGATPWGHWLRRYCGDHAVAGPVTGLAGSLSHGSRGSRSTSTSAIRHEDNNESLGALEDKVQAARTILNFTNIYDQSQQGGAAIW